MSVSQPSPRSGSSRSGLDLIAEQIESNRSALSHVGWFAGHRERLTQVALAGRHEPSDARICVLGAGNCHDLDLVRLTSIYREVHLVDIDQAALDRAYEAQGDAARRRIVRHAPVDLSGFLDKIERWRAFEVTPGELIAHPDQASRAIVERLPGPFDLVLSTCLLSQMQLAVLHALSSAHRLFEPMRHILNLTHLRTLARLAGPSGRAILATDVSSNLIHPLETVGPSADLHSLLDELVAAGNVIQVLQPGLLAWTVEEDPELRRYGRLSPPLDVWLWHNGPERIFLVYATELRRQ